METITALRDPTKAITHRPRPSSPLACTYAKIGLSKATAELRVDTTNRTATGDHGAMTPFTIPANPYLRTAVSAFYHTPYIGWKKAGNPDYLNDLKNTFNNFSSGELRRASQQLRDVLLGDLPAILRATGFQSMTVCVVPRAKAENSYHANQLLFKSSVQEVVAQLVGFDDGTGHLSRHTNTKTTHLRNPVPNYNNDGAPPFPGITTQTCHIAGKIKAKDILLIDDIYTPGVNIDEDAIQALIDTGVRSVTFYAVAKTRPKG